MFTSPLNKQGKTTATGEKNATILNNASSRAVLGVALTGHGTIATMARNHLKGQADTLPSMLASGALDGSQWGDLLALLVAEFGTGQFSRATMRGKTGCTGYLDSVRSASEAAYARAETRKAQDRALETLERIDAAIVDVDRLLAVSQAQIDAATLAAMATETATESATQSATESATESA